MNYLVKFERIGRRRDIPDLPVTVTEDKPHAQQIAAAVYRYARRFIVSSSYLVDLDLSAEGSDGVGGIDCGRFGRFTISPQPDQAAGANA